MYYMAIIMTLFSDDNCALIEVAIIALELDPRVSLNMMYGALDLWHNLPKC